MKRIIDIKSDDYNHILETINPFIELNGVRLSFNEIRENDAFVRGGLLALMGVDFTKYKHLVIVSNNPFLGDNLALTLPVVNFLKSFDFIETIDVYLPFHKLFKSDNHTQFIDWQHWSSIYSKITDDTLIISFSLVEGELKQTLELIETDVLMGLNDKYTNFYNKGALISSLTNYFYDSDYFGEDYTEGIRSQLNLNSSYRKNITFDASELVNMVKSYLERTNKNWDNHLHWLKIFNGSYSDLKDSLYSNVYEYDVWMFKLLFGSTYKWSNFQELLFPKDFQKEKNLKVSSSLHPFIFININVNSAKLIWQNNECGIIDYVLAILNDSLENNYRVVFTHPSFEEEVNQKIYELIHTNSKNAVILSSDDIVDWIPFMKSAKSVVSFDTGFVHLAYLYNTNVLSVGGQSFFWHFPDTDYVNFNHIDNSGIVDRSIFIQSLSKVLNWIKND